MKTPHPLRNPLRALLATCAFSAILNVAPAQNLQITTLAGSTDQAGSADGTGSGANFYMPGAVAVDSAGNVYVADTWNMEIRRVTPAGVVTTLAGAPGARGSADGTGSVARFYAPEGVAVDSDGNVYVGDSGNCTIRKITPTGVVTTLAGVAGTAGSADGTGAAATFASPRGLAVDANGNLLVADWSNNTIRKVTPAGIVTTIAGTARVAGSADGYGAGANFNGPYGVAVDATGNLFVSDWNNHTIRKITPSGAVSTVAGTPGVYGSTDGAAAAATFGNPGGLAVDGGGNIFVVDENISVIRKITPLGTVSTIAGSPWRTGFANGTGAAANFFYPAGLAIDAASNVYVADTSNELIRKGVASGAPQIGTPPLSQSVIVGSAVTLTVAASSVTQMSYQWSFNGVAIAGATSASYTTRPIQLSDEGFYSVAVTNSAGTSTGIAQVTAGFSHEPITSFSSWSSTSPLPTGTSYVAVAYDGSDFLAVGLDGTAYYSPDGAAWTASASNGRPGQAWGELNSVINVPARTCWSPSETEGRS